MTRTRFCTALAALFLLATALFGKQEQVLSRGFDANRAYQANDIDTIDAMSGNLTLRVPLGTQYGSNGTLSYAFALVYNSNIWDYQRIDSVNSFKVYLEYDEMVQRVDQIQDGDIPAEVNGAESYPPRHFNAGLGWTVSLGDLKDNYTYVDATGAPHKFYTSLHGDTGLDDPTNAAGPLYTRDGTFLRMKKTSNLVRVVEFPDGTERQFVCGESDTSRCNKGPDPLWLLDEVTDPFGNIVYVDRSPALRPASGQWVWTYHQASSSTSGHVHRGSAMTEVRNHVLTFTVSSPYDMRLTTAVLSSPAGPATYQFSYDPRDVFRAYGSTWGGDGLNVPFDSAMKVPVHTLSKIILPEAAGQWIFGYTATVDDPNNNELLTVSWGPTIKFKTYWGDGRLSSATLPTGGRIEYDYEQRAMPARDCFSKAAGNGQVFAVGVSRRRTYDVGTTEKLGEWKYFARRYPQSISGPNSGPCVLPREFVTTAVDPMGAATVSFFSVYHDGGADKAGQAWDKYEYGLPITKAEDDSANPTVPATAPRFLSQQVYGCKTSVFDATGQTLDDNLRRLVSHLRQPGESASCGSPLRAKFLRYENSGLDCTGDSVHCVYSQRRISGERTVYDGSPFTFDGTEYTDYDGLGHYRSAETNGNIFGTIFQGVTGGDRKVTFTDYNPGSKYPGATAVILPSTWILENYASRSVAEAPNGNVNGVQNVAKSELLFNSDNGFLERKRILKLTNGERSEHDTFVVYSRVPDVDGDPTTHTARVTEKWHGGDSQTLDITKPIGETPLPTPEYWIERWLENGGTRKTVYKFCGGTADAAVVEDNTVDPKSGLVTQSADESGALTTLGYDHLGRLTSLKLQGLDVSAFDYQAASGGQGPTVTATRGTGTAKEQAVTHYDGFGHLIREHTRILDDANGQACTSECWNVRVIAYDANGRTTSASVVGFDTKGKYDQIPATKTEYDALGRVKKTTGPDPAMTSTFDYEGAYKVTESVATRADKYLFYDRQRRLVKVTQDPGAPFRYEYDSSDRLVKAISGSDTRNQFIYDNRGALVFEESPEVAAGIAYKNDARGNIVQRTYSNAPETTYDVTFKYDAAERLLQVAHGGQVIKKFTYSSDSSPLSKGKLATATRFNVVPNPNGTGTFVTYAVTTGYDYDPAKGLVSRVTLSSPERGFSADTSYGYDTLGRVISLGYPNTCPQAAPCRRQLTLTYGAGRLTSLTPVASAIHYFPNGMTHRLVRTNGTQDEQTFDTTHQIARPDTYSFYLNNQPFAKFGPIKYSGSGNILTVTRANSTDAFTYDGMGRLTDALVSNKHQKYTYDTFGNIIETSGDSGAGTLSVSSSTNQLTSEAQYDFAGNVTSMKEHRPGKTGNWTIDYDAVGMPIHLSASGIGRISLYDAFDERAAILDYAAAGGLKETWTPRDTGGRVLSDIDKSSSAWTRKRDYVHRGGTVLARYDFSGSSESVVHLHTDPLGTPRAMTGPTGTLLLSRDYLPFGQETIERTDPGRLEFTGHERDEDGGTAAFGDIDYMHARQYSPWLGRFLSVDPAGDHDSKNPQSWNSYAYVKNDPVGLTDPTGRAPADAIDVSPILIFGGRIGPVEASIAAKVLETKKNRDGSYTDVEDVDGSIGLGIKGTPFGVGYTYERTYRGYYRAGSMESYKQDTLETHHGAWAGVSLHRHGSPLVLGGAEVRKTTETDAKFRLEFGVGLGLRIDVNLSEVGRRFVDNAVSPWMAPLDDAVRQLLISRSNGH